MKTEKEEPKQPHRFQAGNKHWLKRSYKGNYKTWKTPEAFTSDCYKYFNWCDKNPFKIEKMVTGGQRATEIGTEKQFRPYTMQGLVNYLGISYQTFLNYESGEAWSAFFEVCTHVRGIVEENQISGAIAGLYNANIVARLLNLADKKSIAVSDQRKSLEELFPSIEELTEGTDMNQKPE